MANLVTKLISKWVFKELSANNHGGHNSPFETPPTTDLNGSIQNHIETEKNKRRIHPYTPQADAEVLIKVEGRANQLDSAINVCGIKFGWSSIIGFLPAIGDALDMFMALIVMNTAMKVSPGKDRDRLKWIMLGNIIIDFLFGLVPFLGDIIDVLFHANERNAVALAKMLNNGSKALEEEKETGKQSGDADDQQSHVNTLPPSYDQTHRGYFGGNDLEKGEVVDLSTAFR